jgi:FtsP/CotA-like multicopper oxidase with cupredoxin domain
MRRFFLPVFAMMALVLFSCDDSGKKEQEEKNPYNILNIEPKTQYNINIAYGEDALRRGTATDVWQYETGLPGGMIIVPRDETLKIHVTNALVESTSVHWHGLRVPYDQDGPSVVLEKGDSHDFQFMPYEMAGTHWYHPHLRPILPQLNMGLYGAFIIKEDYDSKYAGDYVLTLDDWTINTLNNQIEHDNYVYGGAHGNMEVIGTVETVNRRSGANIYPVTLKKGEIVKLRFINASTAQAHTLSMDEHEFRVTHLDGHYLLEPYTAKSIRIAPGERVDVELKGIKSEGTYNIKNERSIGMRIPVIYEGEGKDMASPFVPGASKAFPGITLGQTPNKTYTLTSDEDSEGEMQWKINNVSYSEDPEGIDIFECNLNEVQILRFDNKDNNGIVHHLNFHPLHLHGGHFQVISINGKAPERETWKDTMEIPPGQYIDVAVKFYYNGLWMLHCHIIDHEDGGMLTVIKAGTGADDHKM